VYSYVGTYKRAPGLHVYDLIDQLQIKNIHKSTLLSLVETLHENFDHQNIEYTLNSLDKFYRQTLLSSAIRDGVALLERGEVDKVEEMLLKTLKQRVNTFEPGSKLIDIMDRIRMRDPNDFKGVKLGIDALDIRGLIPTPKELWVLAAPPKGSKTWGLIHVGKSALLQGKTVVHISLEMSEDRIGTRYVQSLFSVTTRPIKHPGPRFAIQGTHAQQRNQLKRPACLQEDADQDRLSDMLIRNPMFSNLTIKEFPTYGLSISGLKAYLDTLEQQKNIVPDVLIVDYADLMQFGSNKAEDMRVEVGKLYKQLRGLAVERNICVVTASQINRSGTSSKKIDATHIADDFSKIGTVDTLLIVQSTQEERDLNLARIFVASGRNDEDKFEIYVEQDLSVGQWALTASEKLDANTMDAFQQLVGIKDPPKAKGKP
jgi:replicative DNA helicase